MAYAESIEDALGHFGKTTDSLVCAVGPELFATACDNFVGIGLVAYVPDYLVRGSVVDIVQGDSEFYCTEAGSEVARIGCAALYHVFADLAAEGLQLLDRKAPDVLGAVDLFQKRHILRYSLNIVSALSGPSEMTVMGTPVSFSI